MSRWYRLTWVPVLVCGLMLILSLSVVASHESFCSEALATFDFISSRLSAIPTGTATREITTGVPMDFDNGVTLNFAPGAEGWVTVTLTDTQPLGLPTGALSVSWWLTTSALTYEVTATFDYNHEGFIGRSEGVDIVLALDNSGSMEEDTLCRGCWIPVPGLSYPEGQRNPFPWDADEDGTPDHCEGSIPLQAQGATYIVIEAEEYGALSNLYDRALYVPGYTYWVPQRNGGLSVYDLPSYLRNDDGAGSLGRDRFGGYISYLPPCTYMDGGLGVPCSWDDLNAGRFCLRSEQLSTWGGPFPSPRADYDFEVPESGEWYLWFRGQGGDSNHTFWGDYIFWGLDGIPIGQSHVDKSGFYMDGADKDLWNWKRAGCGEGNLQPCAQTLTSGTTYTLNIWAGGVGFDLDRLIITDNPSDPDSFFDNNDLSPKTEYQDLVSDVLNAPGNSVADNNRTAWACNPCDDRFGGSPEPNPSEPLCTAAMAPQPYRYLSDLYDDEQWMRSAIEAFKDFAQALDPQRDQLGLVQFNTQASIVSDLQCASRLGSSCTAQVFTDTVITSLDSIHAGGATNLAQALLLGAQVLDPKLGHYARADTAKALVLISDGVPNQLIGVDVPTCYAEDLWPVDDPLYIARVKDCVVYYALRARDQGIVIHTISLGHAADIALLEYIAEVTGGVHFHAPTADQLTDITEELLQYIPRLRANGSLGIYHRAQATEPWQLYPLPLTDWLGYQVTGRGIRQLSQWTLGPVSSTIVVTATPTILPADGSATSTITVDVHGVDSEYQVVTFTASMGEIVPLTGTTVNGRVTAIYTAGLQAGPVILTATTGALSTTAELLLLPLPPAEMTLGVCPSVLQADGQSTAIVTAQVTDTLGQPCVAGTVITFSTSLGTVTPLTSTTVNGVATATLTAGKEAGTGLVTVWAGTLVETVEVEFHTTVFLPIILASYPTREESVSFVSGLRSSARSSR